MLWGWLFVGLSSVHGGCVSGDITMQIWGLLGLNAILTLVLGQSGLQGGLPAPTPEELGSIGATSRAQFRPHSQAVGLIQRFRTKQGTGDPSLLSGSYSPIFSVSDSIYVLLFLFAFFLPSVFISISESFSFSTPISDSVSLLILSFLFLSLFSFLLYFFHIPVSLPLFPDLCEYVSWFRLFPVLFSTGTSREHKLLYFELSFQDS